MTDRIIAASIIGFSLIAAAYINGGRYTVAGNQNFGFIVDRHTGATWACFGVNCTPVAFESR